MTHQRNEGIKTPKGQWETPDWLFNPLSQEFNILCDAAANAENTKKKNLWFGPGSEPRWLDALKIPDWQESTGVRSFWLNPDYTAGMIKKFMAKALEESQKGAVVVCLVPVASDTAWWHNYVMKSEEIRFIKGRVKFIGYDERGNPIKNSPTFSSCVVIFQEMYKKRFTPYIGKTIEQPRKCMQS